MKKISKDTKSLLFLVSGMFLLEFGSELLSSSYWWLGLAMGILGMPIIGCGIYWSIKSIIKTIKQINKSKD